MKKNKGCKYCVKNCKDKSKNGYYYCPDFIEKKSKNIDLPEGFDELFRGFNK